mgnify:CR=1 FL=1
MSDLGGLSGIGGGLEGLDASTRERDAANAKNDDMMYDLNNTASSLSEVATQGMGDGLSAMRDGMGLGGGSELNAGLEDEEPEPEIHAALEDEEEDEPIKAGRSSNIDEGGALFSMTSDYNSKPAEERSSFDSYNLANSDMANDSRQSIDDIFIAGNMNRSFSGGGTSASGGTMYDPSKEKQKVNMSFSMPPFVTKLIGFIIFLVVVYAGLKYGLHINVENYFHPVAVETYRDSDPATVEKALGVKFKTKSESFNSSDYEYKYDVSYAGGLRLVDYGGKRLYIELKGMRVHFSIYDVRSQVSKYEDAVTTLIGHGYKELEETYENTEELGSQGTEHCFYNSKTGEGIIIGKKDQYSAIKSIKYVKNYKKFRKQRAELRNEQY